jgi:hypothetical protein
MNLATNLSHHIAQRKQARRRADITRYRELIPLVVENGTVTLMDELTELAERLGLGLYDLQKDAEQWRAHQQAIAAIPADINEQIARAEADQQQGNDRIAKAEAELKAATSARNGALNRHQNLVGLRNSAEHIAKRCDRLFRTDGEFGFPRLPDEEENALSR